MNHLSLPSMTTIRADAARALSEDVGDGDVTAALIPATLQARATVISREEAVICGTAWFDAAFNLLDPAVHIAWQVRDGDRVAPDQTLCSLHGTARTLLTGERAALNFLQTLSGTASRATQYAAAVAGTKTKVLDTRKTLPGLRAAQKYAVRCGGCYNHRMGLYDAILIKENHIMAAGSIMQAVAAARTLYPDKTVEVEVETFDELNEAIETKADTILLDNFSIEYLRRAVDITRGRAKLEASGGVTLQNIRSIADTGVDFISVGSITKDVKAVDLSMRIAQQQ